METDPEQQATVERILAAVQRKTGFIPVITQIQSTRPDILLPMNKVGDAILFKGDLDRKQKTLCAISAATAAGGEYCVEAQMREALDAGATQDEIFEAIMIGSYMCMTRAQSYALRRYASMFGIETKTD